jgi:hypothetical protein
MEAHLDFMGQEISGKRTVSPPDKSVETRNGHVYVSAEADLLGSFTKARQGPQIYFGLGLLVRSGLLRNPSSPGHSCMTKGLKAARTRR